jgi:hypothetical protein
MFAVVQKVKAGFDDEIVRCIIGVFDDIESANETVIQMNAAMCEAFSEIKTFSLKIWRAHGIFGIIFIGRT